ncbi:hypothetical protein RB595_008029 [Gaeumannomyces hyphopodioides]
MATEAAAKMPIKLPTVRLDTTLAELYARASPRLAGKRVGQVLSGTNSGIGLSNNFPRNSKYLYQDSPFNSADADRDESEAARRELAVKYLSLIPQRDAFITGAAPAVLFNLGTDPDQRAQDRREAERTIAALEADQRPELVFCPGPAEIPVEEAGIDLLACKLMIDGLERYDLVVPAETHWFLNSKAALAQSGLPTPVCDAIELSGHGAEAGLCCKACQQSTDEFVVPELCTGERGRWVDQESAKIYDAVRARALPFVLKNQQTFGGAGTYIVNTEEDRARLLEELRDGVLRRLLSSVTASNSHLKPGTILLSQMVAEPIGDYGVTFFVTDREGDDDPIFLATSEQMTDGPAWIGSTINYARQDELRAKFEPLVRLVGRWLKSHGYVGPAGADVLETAPHAHKNGGCSGHAAAGAATNGAPRDKDGLASEFPHFHIVDLNVRTSGSLCLPLLRGHFTSRGLSCASSFSVSVAKTREQFMRKFQAEFESGAMCIISWYEDRRMPADGRGEPSVLSLADIALGAEDMEALGKAIDRVRNATDEVTF